MTGILHPWWRHIALLHTLLLYSTKWVFYQWSLFSNNHILTPDLVRRRLLLIYLKLTHLWTFNNIFFCSFILLVWNLNFYFIILRHFLFFDVWLKNILSKIVRVILSRFVVLVRIATIWFQLFEVTINKKLVLITWSITVTLHLFL